MKPNRAALCAALILSAAVPALAAGPMNDKKARAQAEHDCYGDIQKLCSDVISDEGKIKACMTAHHAQLSPKCAAAFDAGMSK